MLGKRGELVPRVTMGKTFADRLVEVSDITCFVDT